MKRRMSLFVLVAALVLMLALAAPAQTVNCSGVAAWSPNSVSYSVGALVTYNGSEYKCIQAHTSEPGWDPVDVPALWSLVGTCGSSSATPTATATPKPTATATVTASPGTTATATPKPTATATATPMATATATASGSGGGTACWPAWNSSTAYNGGAQVSYNGVNYQAAYWTQNNVPSTNSGPAGSGQPWIPEGSCGGGGTSATPTATPKPTATATASGGGGGSITGKVFAPYIDMSSALAENLASVSSASGIKTFTGAFIVGSGCTPEWGGVGSALNGNMYNGQSFASNISAFQTAGGTLIISNGGAAGSELADSCMNASSTQAAYQAELNAYGLHAIDFDIETSQTGVDVRSQAVAALEAANPGLVVSVTLPVLPTGLVSNGLNVINSANSHGMRIDTVNVMAMDYGSSQDNGGQMGLDAEDAATATHNQTGMNIGITPMIGVNDTSTEVFQLSDASSLTSWAQGQSYVNRLSYWSVGRDNGSCAGSTSFASATCSGLSQSNYQFASIFEAF